MSRKRKRYEAPPTDASDVVVPSSGPVTLEPESDDVVVYLLFDLTNAEEQVVRRNVRVPQTIKIKDIYGFRGRVKTDGLLYADSCMLIKTNGEECPVRGSMDGWLRRVASLKEKINRRNPIGFKIGVNVKPKTK